MALGFASRDDVLYALAQQFHYPYAPEAEQGVSEELVVLREPFSARAEAFRALRSQIIMRVNAADEPRRALAVISPDAGDGKTYCAANLAVTLAQLGGRTLLVDADMRGPRQHEVFGLEAGAGLSGILAGRSDSQVIQQVAGVPSLFVLPVGTTPPNPLELVERPAFGLLMRELSSKFDHVIVDTPAADLRRRRAVIAARCGAALIVARKNASRVAWLQELVASFAGSPVGWRAWWSTSSDAWPAAMPPAPAGPAAPHGCRCCPPALDLARVRHGGGWASLLLYVPTYVDLANTIWATDEQGHGPIILAVSLWLLYARRHAIADCARAGRRPVAGWPLFVLRRCCCTRSAARRTSSCSRSARRSWCSPALLLSSAARPALRAGVVPAVLPALHDAAAGGAGGGRDRRR